MLSEPNRSSLSKLRSFESVVLQRDCVVHVRVHRERARLGVFGGKHVWKGWFLHRDKQL